MQTYPSCSAVTDLAVPLSWNAFSAWRCYTTNCEAVTVLVSHSLANVPSESGLLIKFAGQARCTLPIWRISALHEHKSHLYFLCLLFTKQSFLKHEKTPFPFFTDIIATKQHNWTIPRMYVIYPPPPPPHPHRPRTHYLCLCFHLSGLGWRAAIRPADHPVANFEFDVVVGADGRRNTLEGETTSRQKVLTVQIAQGCSSFSAI